KPVLQPVPTGGARQLPRAKQYRKLRFIKPSGPMVAGGAVQVPRHHPPLFRKPAIVEQKMVSVIAIPVLDEDTRCQIVNVLLQIDALSEEIKRVGRARQFVAKVFQIAKAIGLLRLFVVMIAVSALRS